MGQNYNCGCRTSSGAWYLCNRHEEKLLEGIDDDFDLKMDTNYV